MKATLSSLGLAALLLFPSCDRREELAGPALKGAIRSFLASDSTEPVFSGNPSEIQALILSILSEGKGGRPGQDTAYITGLDGKKRALGIHAPQSYSPSRPVPLVLWLHGGVNGDKQDRGAEVAYYFAKEADSLYFIFAAVSGERGATWFDPIGIGNVREAVRTLKLRYNVDDNRVILAGVSDGGVGCYISGMHYPADFAGYIVCSASPDLLPALGVPFLPANMRLRQWLIIHGGRDRLFPGERIKEYVSLFRTFKAPLAFHYHDTAGHGLEYMALEKPFVMDFIRDVRREAMPSVLALQAAGPMALSWIRVDSTDGTASLRAEKRADTVMVTSEKILRFSLLACTPLFRFNERIVVVINGNKAVSRTCAPDPLALLSREKARPDKAIMPFCILEFTVE